MGGRKTPSKQGTSKQSYAKLAGVRPEVSQRKKENNEIRENKENKEIKDPAGVRPEVDPGKKENKENKEIKDTLTQGGSARRSTREKGKQGKQGKQENIHPAGGPPMECGH